MSRLVDPDTDREVPTGEVGELIVRYRQPWTCSFGYFDVEPDVLEQPSGQPRLDRKPHAALGSFTLRAPGRPDQELEVICQVSSGGASERVLQLVGVGTPGGVGIGRRAGAGLRLAPAPPDHP